MKALPLLLAASLVANIVLVLPRARPDWVSFAGSPENGANASSAPPAGSSAPSASAATDLAAALKSQDPESLRDALRVIGLPAETVRMMVTSAVWSRYQERMKALRPNPEPDRPWWKNETGTWSGGMSREQRAELRKLQREAGDEALRLLGPGKENTDWGWRDPRLAFLPDAKRKDLQEIEQDYQDLLNEVQQDMQGFVLPSDSEKIRFLQEEKKRDLAALLTPQELADYDLRMSNTAQQLRWKMTRFDASEEEYRKIFALQKAFDDARQTDAYGNPVRQGPEDWKQRQEAEKALTAQFKEALGPDRYADYDRSQNDEYQQLVAVSRRLSLPPGTATAVFNLRHEIAAESRRIADDANLDAGQKKQAFADLAARSRDEVRARLGDEAAEVYLRSGMHWLKNVGDGNVLTFFEEGNRQGSRPGIPKEPKKPAAK